jgi:hypothetical protein
MTINRLGAALPTATQFGEINDTGETIIFDCLGYTFLAVQVFSSGSATIAAQISNDKIEWVDITLDTPSNLGSASPTPLIWAREYKVCDRYLKLSFPALSASLKVSGFLGSTSGDASNSNQLISDRLMPAGTQISFLGTSAGATLKNSAGNLYSIACINLNSSKRYFQVFDKASPPVSGDIPMQTYPIPATTSNADGLILIGQDLIGGSGIACPTGVGWGFSSTPLIYTAGSAADCVAILRWV